MCAHTNAMHVSSTSRYLSNSMFLFTYELQAAFRISDDSISSFPWRARNLIPFTCRYVSCSRAIYILNSDAN
jgi:hypothetical protein